MYFTLGAKLSSKKEGGKRKREESKQPSQTSQPQSFKGMMESYYSSRTRQDLLSTNERGNNPQNNNHNHKVHFDLPKESSAFSQNDGLTEASEGNENQSAFSHFASTPSHPLLEDAMQNMLMAWYHSGYATGRYETLKELSYLLPYHEQYTQQQNVDLTSPPPL